MIDFGTSILGLLMLGGNAAPIVHAMTPREERWRQEQLRRGRDPRDIDAEADVRKAIVSLRDECSRAVMEGKDWKHRLELMVEVHSRVLERCYPKMGRKFIALIEQLDNDDLLTPEAYAIAFPRQPLPFELTAAELKEVAAHHRSISDAAFPR